MAIRFSAQKFTMARLSRVLSVMAIAMAAGHLVQTLAAGKKVQRAEAEAVAEAHAEAQAMIAKPTDIVMMSAGSEDAVPAGLDMPAARPVAPDLDAKLAAAPDVTEVPLAPEPVTQAAACPIDLALDAGLGAALQVDVIAPCHAQERVVLRHAGLAVAFRLDAAGKLAVELPVLMAHGQVEVGFADGNAIAGELPLDPALLQHRFGVQWQGPEAFALHGFENGADFGQAGHVSVSQRLGAAGSALMVLGDPSVDLPLLAQIYTYPDAGIAVELLVEAAVTPDTCGQELLGEVIDAQGGEVTVTDLSLVMPECSGVGDFLVLKNLPAEMKLATN